MKKKWQPYNRKDSTKFKTYSALVALKIPIFSLQNVPKFKICKIYKLNHLKIFLRNKFRMIFQNKP